MANTRHEFHHEQLVTHEIRQENTNLRATIDKLHAITCNV